MPPAPATHSTVRSSRGCSPATISSLTAPFAAALMDRFGIRRVTTAALLLIAAGSGLTVFVAASWQLVLSWGVLIGLGTGSMALVFAATVAQRWFVRHRGLVTGILTAGSANAPSFFSSRNLASAVSLSLGGFDCDDEGSDGVDMGLVSPR